MSTAKPNPRGRAARKLAVTALLAGTAAIMGGCGGLGAPSLTGVWQADDGTGLKTVNANGSCSGMFYSRGNPLDIGGAMTCTLGDKGPDGTYTLVVRQPPNEADYRVQFDGPDTVVLLTKSGSPIVTLTRQ